MTCNNELLNLYVDGMLDENSKREVESHAADCAECGSTLVFLRGYKAALAAGINEVEPPATLLPSALAAARVAAANTRRQTAVAHVGGKAKRTNWRAWMTAAAAVIVAVGVGVAVLAWQGVFTGYSKSTTDAAPKMAAAAYDMAVEEATVEEAAPAAEEAAPAAEAAAGAEPAPTPLPDEATASGAEAPATENEAGDSGATDVMPQPLEIEISPKYFAPVVELLNEQNVPLEADERGEVYTCVVPDDSTATALHKLLKKFGLKVTVTAGQQITFTVTE